MQFTNQATIEIYADGADINDMREMAKLRKWLALPPTRPWWSGLG